MQTLKTTLVILSTLLILACNNQPNKPSNGEANAIATKKNPETKNQTTKPNQDLTKFGIANNPGNVLGGLKLGDKAPDFKMLNQDGEEESLAATLKDGPVLLVFLRAEWCSFCVRHLQEFQDNIQAIHNTGKAKVIAVSPQERSYMQEFHEEHAFSFPILNDQDHSVMKDYKVLFHVTDKYNNYIEKAKGKRIEVFNGDAKAVMPVPATYLIGQDQVIKYVHYDPDYKKRSDLKEVIGYL